MHARLRPLAACLLLAGCGLSVDVGRFYDAPGSSDAGGADGGSPDGGGPATLTPTTILEAEGGGLDGPGLMFHVGGGPFSGQTRVTTADALVVISTPTVGSGGLGLAFRAWFGPRADLGDGARDEVVFTVVDGEQRANLPIVIEGLDELELAGTVRAEDVTATYADIRTTGPVVVTGSVGLQLRSPGAIRIGHRVFVSADPTRPGPGGLGPSGGERGGADAPAVGSGCAPGGGGAGGDGDGEASRGGSAGGLEAPLENGLPRIGPYAGHGGGRGGDSGADSGVLGGAGAGALWIEGGRVQVDADIEAVGGAGEDADGAGCGQRAFGAGGGGGGGYVFIRTRELLGSATVDISGGLGGAGGQKGGGRGADGWLRVDAPAVDGLSARGASGGMPSPYRGPAWLEPTSTATPGADLRFVGPPGASLVLEQDDLRLGVVEVGEMGGGVVPAPSAPGHHVLCLSATASEEPTCIGVVVLR